MFSPGRLEEQVTLGPESDVTSSGQPDSTLEETPDPREEVRLQHCFTRQKKGNVSGFIAPKFRQGRSFLSSFFGPL